jgi:hypothetical protein
VFTNIKFDLKKLLIYVYTETLLGRKHLFVSNKAFQTFTIHVHTTSDRNLSNATKDRDYVMVCNAVNFQRMKYHMISNKFSCLFSQHDQSDFYPTRPIILRLVNSVDPTCLSVKPQDNVREKISH